MVRFSHGGYEYAVNPNLVRFVVQTPTRNTHIFFGSDENDYISVNQSFNDAVLRLETDTE